MKMEEIMNAKKISVLLLMVLVMSIISSFSISAACPNHPPEFTVTYCSGIVSKMVSPTCVWHGGYGGGSYHAEECVIIQTWKQTWERCVITGCAHNVKIGEHLCYYRHSLATPAMEGDYCPY